METLAFLESLVRALGSGWSVRYGVVASYGVLGVTLTCDVGGSVEVVPSLVRGDAVIWSPFVFTRGTRHYDLHTDGAVIRTPLLDEAVAVLERWRRSRGGDDRTIETAPIAKLASRIARARRVRTVRTTEVDLPVAPAVAPAPAAAMPVPPRRGARLPLEPLADALRDRRLGEIKRARELAVRRDRHAAAGELMAIARRSRGDARANALGVLVGIASPEHGAELASYLADPERSVRRVAIDGVKRTGYTAAVPALAALVLDRDGRLTSARSKLATEAASAMKALSGQRGAAALIGYLSAEDPRVREAACVAFTLFASRGTRQARPELQRLLADRDPRVVKAARRALAAR